MTLVSVSSAAGDVLATFAAAGIPATDDPRDFNPPGLLLGAPTVSFRYGKGCADLEWFGYLAAGNAGAGATLAALSGLVDRLDGTGAAVVALVEEMRAMIDDAMASVAARQAEELAELDARVAESVDAADSKSALE